MPRRGQISKREVLPDPMYNSQLVTKLVNNVMLDGKKGVAQKIVYEAFAMVEAKSGENALDVFQKALENDVTVAQKNVDIINAEFEYEAQMRKEREEYLKRFE